MRLLPEEERLETLAILSRNRADVERALQVCIAFAYTHRHSTDCSADFMQCELRPAHKHTRPVTCSQYTAGLRKVLYCMRHAYVCVHA